MKLRMKTALAIAAICWPILVFIYVAPTPIVFLVCGLLLAMASISWGIARLAIDE